MILYDTLTHGTISGNEMLSKDGLTIVGDGFFIID